jgi:hypothetical protein
MPRIRLASFSVEPAVGFGKTKAASIDLKAAEKLALAAINGLENWLPYYR